jgi:hypothetical protein
MTYIIFSEIYSDIRKKLRHGRSTPERARVHIVLKGRRLMLQVNYYLV